MTFDARTNSRRKRVSVALPSASRCPVSSPPVWPAAPGVIENVPSSPIDATMGVEANIVPHAIVALDGTILQRTVLRLDEYALGDGNASLNSTPQRSNPDYAP